MAFSEKGEVFSAKLKHSDMFLPITGTDERGGAVLYYGGDQAWFSTRVGRYSGCGAVAAADIFAYLALWNPELSPLFTADSPVVSVDRFRDYMEAVIKYVAPGKIPFTDIPYGGLTSIERFTRYCDRFAKSRGTGLTGRFFDGNTLSFEQACAAVAEQLERDNPVALLVMQNAKLKSIPYTDACGKPAEADVRFHWMVITQLLRSGGKTEITVSSEGARLTLDFHDVWTCDACSKIGWRGLVYFIRSDL